MKNKQQLPLLNTAVHAALQGDWEQAHAIAQDCNEPLAHWVHAVLHKIEGDAGNSRYWYARAGKNYDAYSNTSDELNAIARELAGKASESG